MGACDGWSWEQSKGDLLISGLHTYMTGGGERLHRWDEYSADDFWGSTKGGPRVEVPAKVKTLKYSRV